MYLHVIFLSLTTVVLGAACNLHAHCATDHAYPTRLALCVPVVRQCIHVQNAITNTVVERQIISDMVLGKAVNISAMIQVENQRILTETQRQLIISLCSLVYSMLSPHRFYQLNRLRFDVEKAFNDFSKDPELVKLTNIQFHQRVSNIIQQMDDGHAVYFLPGRIGAVVATLGFNAAVFFEADHTIPIDPKTPRYIVNSVVDGLDFVDKRFHVGVEILTVNGKPISTVIRKLGRQSAGSNRASRDAQAIVLLTTRRLITDMFPETEAVYIKFRTTAGEIATIRIPWLYFDIPDFNMLQLTMSSVGIPAMNAIRTNSPVQKGYKVWGVGHLLRMLSTRMMPLGGIVPVPVSERLRGVFTAEIIMTSRGRIGRIILPSFRIAFNIDFNLLRDELIRVLGIMPSTGLILDLRDNRGGEADFAKMLAELTSHGGIQRQPLTVRANNFTKGIFFEPFENVPPDERLFAVLTAMPYRGAVQTALKSGEVFAGPASNLFSAIQPLPRQYFGPMVTLVNGATFSAGDVFTAIQKDLELSTVVGMDSNIGAGGATSMAYGRLSAAYPRLLPRLPQGAEFSFSFARFYRTGRNAGRIIEGFGVTPDVRYFRTRRDVLDGDKDLFEFLGKGLVDGFEKDMSVTEGDE